MDKEKSNEDGGQYNFFIDNKFDVKTKCGVSNGKYTGIMHHKVCIFDNKLVLTGSYNFTPSAEKYNYENALFISDAEVVKQYRNMFSDLWNAMTIK